MLNAETRRRIDACRDVLVGKLPLPTDQVELITLTLIYKFMDDLDEEAVRLGGKRSFFVNGLESYRWRNLLPQTVSAEERMTRFARGIELLGGAEVEMNGTRTVPATHIPLLFRDIFRNAFLKFRDGRILTLFLNEIDGFTYSHSEELGNAFEYLLQSMGTQGENGQFRTPRHIIDFIVACLEPTPDDKILDPACGTGGFLVSAYKQILAKHTSPGSKIPGDKLTHAQRQKLYKNLAGYDTTDLMVKLSKVNLFLHGFPDPAIHIYDTLSNDARWNEKADLILANPPFMTPKGGVVPHNKFRIPARKAEVLFTDYIAEHLTVNGRAGVIVPNGIVATTQNAYTQLRKFLVEDSLIAVISLPAGVFKPYSGVKTSILLLDKKLARQRKDILFLKIKNDGYDLGDQRREINENDLPEGTRLIKGFFNNELNESMESSVAFRMVEKVDLLKHSNISLTAERFFGVSETIDATYPRIALGEVLSFVGSGVTPRGGKSTYLSSGVRFIRSQNVQWGSCDFSDIAFISEATHLEMMRTEVQPMDVLLNITGASIGRSAVYADTQKANVNQHVAILRPTEKLLPSFLCRCLISEVGQNQIQNIQSGASREAVNYEQIKEIEIPLPSLEEQERFACEIQSYQNVIDGARQILDSYRPRIYLNPQWEYAQLGEVCQVGGAIVKDFDKRLPYIGSDSIESGTGRLIQMKSCEQQGILGPVYEFSGTRLLYSKIRPYLNKLTLTSFHGYCSSDVYPLRIDEKKAIPQFVKYHLLSDRFMSDIAGFHERVSIPKINRVQLFGVMIPLPPVHEQQQIVAELEAEAAQMAIVRSLIQHFEVKIQRVLDRVWGNYEQEVVEDVVGSAS